NRSGVAADEHAADVVGDGARLDGGQRCGTLRESLARSIAPAGGTRSRVAGEAAIARTLRHPQLRAARHLARPGATDCDGFVGLPAAFLACACGNLRVCSPTCPRVETVAWG